MILYGIFVWDFVFFVLNCFSKRKMEKSAWKTRGNSKKFGKLGKIEIFFCFFLDGETGMEQCKSHVPTWTQTILTIFHSFWSNWTKNVPQKHLSLDINIYDCQNRKIVFFSKSPINFILIYCTINFAKDLAWKKIFRGRSIDLKIGKSKFFFRSFAIFFYFFLRYLIRTQNFIYLYLFIYRWYNDWLYNN